MKTKLQTTEIFKIEQQSPINGVITNQMTAEKMQTQNEKADLPNGFWRRQFQTQSTKAQTKFDWAFGVILPIVCFTFDPIVFQGGSGFYGAALLEEYKAAAYILSFVSVMAMAARLIWGEKLKSLNAVLAGFFAAGALISLGIGILIAPLSLLGLIILIGVLGFTPLFTSIVYLRNALRAFESAKPFFEKPNLMRVAALSAILTAVVPYVFNPILRQILEAMEK